jgi:DNA-binding transcriptional ArsR family regulator
MTTPTRRDPLTLAGLAVVALAAAATSFTTLADLARDAGWSSHVDVMAMVSTRAWLSGPAGVRALARRTALLCIASSVAGNAVAHLINAGVMHSSVWLVILVAMVPPVGLGVVAHLAAALAAAPAEPVVELAEASEPAPAALGELAAPQEFASPVTAPLLPAPPVPALAVSADARTDTTPDVIADAKPDTERTPARTLTRTDTASKIKRLRERHPDMTVIEIADKVGVTDRTVRRHLAALATV